MTLSSGFGPLQVIWCQISGMADVCKLIIVYIMVVHGHLRVLSIKIKEGLFIKVLIFVMTAST